MDEFARATKDSWNILPPPTEREHFVLSLTFSFAEGERMKRGSIPGGMDDKWFIFFEKDWLYFHRSWTGACIFGAHLESAPDGVKIVDAWASRDEREYKSTGRAVDEALIVQLLNFAARMRR